MRTLTIFLISLFSLPLVLNAQSVDEMLQKVSAAIEAGQNGASLNLNVEGCPTLCEMLGL